MTAHPALATWHKLVATRDAAGLDTLLAPDCVFHSPMVHAPQRGHALSRMYLGTAFRVFFNPSFHYVREVVEGRLAVLEFEVTIDGITVNGVDMITWNEAGQITDFKVMLRPLKAINLIHEKMGALLKAGTAPKENAS